MVMPARLREAPSAFFSPCMPSSTLATIERTRRAMTAAIPPDDAKDGRLRGPADPKRIDVHAAAEMRHWVRELGRPALQVKNAVSAVGPLVADVRAHLQKRSLYGLR
jgi:Protein of unknown function (DUF3606)